MFYSAVIVTVTPDGIVMWTGFWSAGGLYAVMVHSIALLRPDSPAVLNAVTVNVYFVPGTRFSSLSGISVVVVDAWYSVVPSV